MKKQPDQHPRKKSLLGRLSSGIKKLLGGTPAPGSPAPSAQPARSKKDLFPDEPHDTSGGPDGKKRRARGGRPDRPGRSGPPGRGREKQSESPAAASPAASGPEESPRSSRSNEAARPRSRGERSAAPKESHEPREPREARENREPREPRSPRDPRERGGRSARGRDSGEGRAPRSAPLPPAGPPPEPPAEPTGPFPEAFQALGLSPRVLGGIGEMGYTTPTTIQEKAIPLSLAGRDIIGASQTGTGKTAAFGLPILTRLGAPQNAPRVLILEPTRELASQVVEAFDRFNKYTALRTVAVYGGVGYDKQRRAIHEGVDVIVATPGRLLDFIGDRTISLASIEYLVLDEVDRMLDMGFLPDVRKIVDSCPEKRQTAFFSATMPAQIKTLANWALTEPAEVEIGIRYSPAETVSHYFYPVAADQREQLLKALLDQTDWHSIMIFTRTKMQADRIFATLSTTTEHKAAVMHSDIPQRDREKALAGFRDGSFEVIVATDLAARGLDISGVTHVINYQVPENPEDYVHRIGRTGRAQKEGDAYTLLSADELESAESIERLIGQKIERRQLEGFPYEYTALLDPHAGSADKFKKLYRSAKPGGKRRR